MVELKFPETIYEDDFLVVIFKPVGWVVNRAQSVKGKTIQDWMEETGRIKAGGKSPFYQRSGMVHRLDKVTSGLLILAKKETAFIKLMEQFKQRTVQKEYRALVHGWPNPPQGTIELPIARKSGNRKQFGVVLGGRAAMTRYEVLRRYFTPSDQPVSLLKLFPKTGRTHQLRVHLKYQGHPIVGDPVYGGRKNIKKDKNWCPRLFLHAHTISFIHPETGRRVEFSSLLPPELTEVLDLLKEKE
ncbi:RluA family pseudouridine synthase [Patescibacteria group bacterium]|nr:RluA family pseudouridine synthase [Patescibacteria group bacterium]